MTAQQSKIIKISGIIIASIFVVIISRDLYEESQIQDVRVPLTTEEAQELTLEEYIAAKDDYQIIDIREIEEFEQGHFTDAVHLPLGELLASTDKQEELRALLKTKKVAFFCHDGLRSQIAVDTLGGDATQLVIFHRGHKQVRNKDLSEELWVGSRKRVLPEDFHNALKAREYDLADIPPGALIADVTWDQVYRTRNAEAIAAPLMRLTQEEIDEIVSDIAPRSFISVCNSRMSCFYAKILGYRVEKENGYFSGYYRIGEGE